MLNVLRRHSRVPEDAGLAIVLSVFFGLGVVLLQVIQQLPRGNIAGLQNFIFGKASALIGDDVVVIAVIAAAVLLLFLIFFKEFRLLCFDAEYASALGWPVRALDLMLMALVVVVTIVSLQSVGILLVTALLVLPPVSARFWTDRLPRMTFLSAAMGGLSAVVGVFFSALFPRMPTGPIIVLAGGVLFVASLLFGPRRGIFYRWLEHRRTIRRVGQHDLLRSLFELEEDAEEQARESGEKTAGQLPSTSGGVLLSELQSFRSWKQQFFRRLLRWAEREQLIETAPARRTTGGGLGEFKAETGGLPPPLAGRSDGPDRLLRLTDEGRRRAGRIVRNHRLWEEYLIHHADIAPSHVDRDADEIEHFLDPATIVELERLARKRGFDGTIPPSPHPLASGHGTGAGAGLVGESSPAAGVSHADGTPGAGA